LQTPSPGYPDDDQAPIDGAHQDGVPLAEKLMPFDFRRGRTRVAAGDKADQAGATDPAAPDLPGVAPPPQLPTGEGPRRIAGPGDDAEPGDGHDTIDVRLAADGDDSPTPDGGDTPPRATACTPDVAGVPQPPPELSVQPLLAAALGLQGQVGALPSQQAGRVLAYVTEAIAAAEDITVEVARKLEADPTPSVMGQGLQRLAQTLAPERLHGAPGTAGVPGEGLSGDVADALQRVAALLARARLDALAVLEGRLSLQLMPPQEGMPIDPVYHNVIESEEGSDASRDNTVLREEAPGWLFSGDVLAPAEVVRYTCPGAAGPALPDIGDLGPRKLDDDVLGKRR